MLPLPCQLLTDGDICHCHTVASPDKKVRRVKNRSKEKKQQQEENKAMPVPLSQIRSSLLPELAAIITLVA